MTSLCVPSTQLLKPPPSPATPCLPHHLGSQGSLDSSEGQGRAAQEPWHPRPPARPPAVGRISATPATAAGFRLHKASRVLQWAWDLPWPSSHSPSSSSLGWPHVCLGFSLSFLACHCCSSWPETTACSPRSPTTSLLREAETHPLKGLGQQVP